MGSHAMKVDRSKFLLLASAMYGVACGGAQGASASNIAPRSEGPAVSPTPTATTALTDPGSSGESSESTDGNFDASSRPGSTVCTKLPEHCDQGNLAASCASVDLVNAAEADRFFSCIGSGVPALPKADRNCEQKASDCLKSVSTCQKAQSDFGQCQDRGGDCSSLMRVLTACMQNASNCMETESEACKAAYRPKCVASNALLEKCRPVRAKAPPSPSRE